MTLEDVLDLYALLEAAAIPIWLEGGWGVDALLGHQTRAHDDLDCIVQHHDLPQMRAVLERAGFRMIDDEHWWHFIMADENGRALDVRVVTLDALGNGLYGPPDLHLPTYPVQSLATTGMLQGQIVRCLSAEQQVAAHTGYELDEQDFQDVYALHERFGVPLPAPYQR
jgi:lincosamide nucleotidyltransferase A/C/D/E